MYYLLTFFHLIISPYFLVCTILLPYAFSIALYNALHHYKVPTQKGLERISRSGIQNSPKKRELLMYGPTNSFNLELEWGRSLQPYKCTAGGCLCRGNVNNSGQFDTIKRNHRATQKLPWKICARFATPQTKLSNVSFH